MLVKKAAKQARIVVRIGLKDYNGSNDEYFYEIPRQTLKQNIQITRKADSSNIDEIAGLKVFNTMISDIKPAEDKGTTLPFTDFLQNIIPDADEDFLKEILDLGGKTKAELVLRDDVIIEE